MPSAAVSFSHSGSTKDPKNYVPSATLRKFHNSQKWVRGIMGPIGSGKTVACVIELLLRARAQAPYRGVRSTRWAIIRNTYPQLKNTTIKTWQEWISPTVCKIVYGTTITGRIYQQLDDGTWMDAEFLFMSMDNPRDAANLMSLELTGAWLNEARWIRQSHFKDLLGRVDRYPSPAQGGCTWSGLIMDTNPPNTRHWWYKLAEEKLPEGYEFWKQPPALIRRKEGTRIWWEANPLAENILNLNSRYGYYTRQIPGSELEWIKVFLEGQYGNIFEGKPVYEESYVDSVHCSEISLPIYRGLPLYYGWDFGLNPTLVIAQMTPRGRLHVLREFCGKNVGLRQFVTSEVLPGIQDLKGMKIISTGDPSGKSRNQIDAVSCFDELERLGIPTVEASTNDFLPRRESVIGFLQRMIDGSAGFLLDPDCVSLREGFQGGYQYARVQVTGEERYHEMPLKDMFSHPHDALQCICLKVQEPLLVETGVEGRRAPAPEQGSWGAVT